MHDNPYFSVIIPLFNKEATVERALKSVLSQTFRDFEIVVVNDGSTDRGADVVRTFDDSRIRVFHQENQGVSAARNLGIMQSRSDCLAFLDADDEWNCDHLDVLSCLRKQHPECDVFVSSYLFGMEGEGTWPAAVRGLPADWSGVLSDYFSVAATSDPPLWTSAVAVMKKTIQSRGMFPVGVPAGEDLLTWARLAVKYRIAYSTKPTAVFWQSPGHVYRGQPTRIPDTQDFVGGALRDLLSECGTEQKPALRKYISLWHKMRASIYMRLGKRKESYAEIRQALRYNPWAYKLYAYTVIAALPASIQSRIFRALSSSVR